MSTADVAFLRSVTLLHDQVPSWDRYPFSIPAVRALDGLQLDPHVTFLVGENGSGKSTIIEALAVALGFNPEGGSQNFRFETRRTDSDLHKALRLVRGPRRPRDGFFLRAESFYNAATYVEQANVSGYGDRSLHEQSHGESFVALINHRFRGQGLYLLDEPEAALSPMRQLTVLQLMHQLVSETSQFIIATHSPILLAFPGATILQLGPSGLERVRYEETEHYQVTKSFLASPERYLHHLFREG